MAFCSTDYHEKYGYEISRFEKDVDETFHCSICYNVLKDPRMCKNNEHVFCVACITQHLKTNAQTCPECNEDLTTDTLRRPRVVNKYLSKLRINCDYASRGCLELTCLEHLQTHVESCGYAPVLCSNTECGMVINKHDKVHHESEVCEYRKVKCHDCVQIQETVGRMERNLLELDFIAKDMKSQIQDDIKKVRFKAEELGEKWEAEDEQLEALDEKLEALDEKLEAVSEKLGKLDEKLETSREESKKEVGEVKKQIKCMTENLSKVDKDVEKVKSMITQVLEQVNMHKLLTKVPLNTPRGSILIAGGSTDDDYCGEASVEMFSWEKGCWIAVSSMNEGRVGASSFIDKDHLFVAGGDDSKTIESLSLNELPLKWTKLRVELPYDCSDHQTVLCQDRIINIGGYNHATGKYSNEISELKFTSPRIMKKLAQMPEGQEQHCAEVFDGEVFILGGRNSEKTSDSVMKFDPKRNKCGEMPKLPFPLEDMATVKRNDEIIVLGGWNDGAQDIVFAYNCKTGKSRYLPPMLGKRFGCSAVIIGDTIVVLGGKNEDNHVLATVECFTFGSSSWDYLPSLSTARYKAVAEVLPSERKYV